MIEIASEICILAGKDVESSACFSKDTGGEWKMTFIFAAVVIPLACLLPSLEEAWWTSAIGTLGEACTHNRYYSHEFSRHIYLRALMSHT